MRPCFLHPPSFHYCDAAAQISGLSLSECTFEYGKEVGDTTYFSVMSHTRENVNGLLCVCANKCDYFLLHVAIESGRGLLSISISTRHIANDLTFAKI